MGGYGYVLADTVTFRQKEVIFEAGSDPTRESSTSYLRRVAAASAVDFVSSDLFTDGTDAVEFLRDSWPDPSKLIKFAYLDSWDWPYRNMDQLDLLQASIHYESLGRELTEEASADHHLRLAIEVHRLAAPGAVVAFDDTWISGSGVPDGKGRDAVPWLLGKGWKLHGVHVDHWTGGSGQNAFYLALRAEF